jgi:HEAT repeat protein
MLMSRVLVWGIPFLVSAGVGLAPVGFEDDKEPVHRGRSVGTLTAWLRSDDVDMRRDAAQALSELGADAEEAIPDLIAAMRDPDAMVRRRAAEALGNIGPKAKEARTALRWAMMDSDRFVFQSATTALRRIEGGKTPAAANPGGTIGDAVENGAPIW